ncbi:MAG: molybdate ABC transporter permease subunit, partial [Myxococcota bacterium]
MSASLKTKRRLWNALAGTFALLLVAFLLLPIAALLVTLGYDDFVAGITHPSVWPAMRLSLFTTTVSLAIVVVLGTPLAWVMSQQRGQWVSTAETLLRLPAVLPPAVAGVALLLAFGRRGLLGGVLGELGVSIPF